MSPEDARHWKAKLSVPKVAASERLSAYSVGQWPEKKKEQGRGELLDRARTCWKRKERKWKREGKRKRLFGAPFSI